MVVGITSLVVFSYKIFHSRVYPVGMVRKIRTPQEVSDFGTDLEADLTDYLTRDWSTKEIAEHLHLSEEDVKDYLNRVRWKLYAKQQSGLKSGKQQYRLVLLDYWAQKQPSHKSKTKEHALEKEVVEHGETLQFHSERFEEIEKRIRQLEVKSVQELQEATEEKSQPPQVVH